MKSTRIAVVAISIFALFFYIKEESCFACMFLAGTALILAVSAFSARMTGRKMDIAVTMTEYVKKGEHVLLHVKLNNKSKLPVFCMQCKVTCENILTGEKTEQKIIMNAGPSGKSVKEIQLSDKNCGYVHAKVSDVCIYDMFMIFSGKRTVTAESGSYIMPQISPISIDERVLHAYNMESYQYSSYQKGNDPSETFGIREYIEGDSPKTIHWKLTGKTGDLVVRELGLPVENSILLLMDKRLTEGEELSPELRAGAAELFLSISNTLIEKGIGHSVAWMDYRKGVFIMKHIENQQELWAVTGNLMESPYNEDRLSTPVHYIEKGGYQKFASYFYVTAGVDPDEMRLEDCGAVKVYRAENFK